jgi:hypothetical protein
LVLPGSDAKTVEHIEDDSCAFWRSNWKRTHVSVPVHFVQLPTTPKQHQKQIDTTNNHKKEQERKRRREKAKEKRQQLTPTSP